MHMNEESYPGVAADIATLIYLPLGAKVAAINASCQGRHARAPGIQP
jgi:hypothetical protein